MKKRNLPPHLSFPELNPNPIIEMTLTGHVTYNNPAAQKIIEECGMGNDYSVFLPCALEKLLLELTRANNNHLSREVTIKDRIFAENIILIPEASFLRIYAVEITDHMRADRLLNAKLQAIVSAAPIGIGLVVNRTLMEVNKSFCTMLGYSEDELLGKNARIIYPSDQEYEYVGTVKYERMAENGFGSVETKLKCKDGRIIDILMFSSFIELGHPEKGAAFTVLDITERKQSEEQNKALLRAVQNEKDRLSSLLNSIDDEIWFTDKKKKVTLVNPAAAKAFGLESTRSRKVENIASSFEVYRPDGTQRPPEEAPPLRALKGEIVREQEEIVRMPKTGELRHRQVNAAPVKNNKGSVIGSVAVVRDITEFLTIQKKLTQQLTEIETIYNSTPVGLCVVDLNLRYLRINAKLAEMNGMPAEDHIGRTIREIIPEFATLAEDIAQRIVMTGEPIINVEASGATPADPGKIRYWNEQWLPLKDIAGNIWAISVVIEEITERKLAEEVLRQSRDDLEIAVRERTAELTQAYQALEAERRRFHQVLDELPVYVALLTPDYKLRLTNKVFRDHFGDPQGLTCFEHLFQRQKPCEDCQTYQVLSTMKPNEWEWHGPGERIYNVHDFPFHDTDGSILVLEMGVDITEQKRAENERQRLEAQVRQSHKMEAIGTLAGGIAHDFNNMLAVILGNAELALDDLNKDGPVENLQNILKAALRSRDLVKQILAFSGKKGEDSQALHIIPLLKETYDLLRATIPSTIEMKLEVHTKDDLITANQSQIQQVILNLASNAAHAMRNGGGILTISLTSMTLGSDSFLGEEIRGSGRYVKLTIRDTGEGISPEIRQRIFEPFFSTKERTEHAGMGLSVVYGIVSAHHGFLEVESEMGMGSTFTVIIPRSDQPADKEQEEKISAVSLEEKILFVDDEPDLAAMITLMLEKLGCQVTTCSNGSQALSIFAENPDQFTLIISDYTMPGMTGITLAQQILKIRKDMPIILCTGYSDAVSPDASYRAGIKEFLMKPITRAQMVQAIHRAMTKPRPQPYHPPKM